MDDEYQQVRIIQDLSLGQYNIKSLSLGVSLVDMLCTARLKHNAKKQC